MEACAEALTLPLFTGFTGYAEWEIENVAVFCVEQEVNFRSLVVGTVYLNQRIDILPELSITCGCLCVWSNAFINIFIILNK